MKIERVYRVNHYELIIFFSNGEIREFTYSRDMKNEEFNFLNCPVRLATFEYDESKIKWPIIKNIQTEYNSEKWNQEFELNSDYLYEISKPVEFCNLNSKYTYIGILHHPPTSHNKVRSQYLVLFHPFTKNLEFSLSFSKEVIGDGDYFEKVLALSELTSYMHWKKHFRLSGCEWAIPFIENGESYGNNFMENLMKENETQMVKKGLRKKS